MSKLFYPKLAVNNIKKNGRIFMPYILMNIGIITLFFMMHAISANPALNQMSGGGDLKLILIFGNWVIGIFSAIFIFYTNSFLMKRRKKEIGLYNILGMGKRHLGIMMFLETSILSVLCIGLGILCGMILSKLMFLVMLKILAFAVPLAFNLSLISVALTTFVFGMVFIVTLIYNLGHIHLSKPIELLRGSNVGEREPKTKWLMTLLGIISLGLGYYIAQTVESPLQALQMFFIAVILVMIGTYLLFTAGSIAALKLLKKNTSFYYKLNHFTSVSGMIYRMKQNAVGLSNICILSTAVLVTLSTTFSMYAGLGDVLKERYPNDVIVRTYDVSEPNIGAIQTVIDETAKKHHVKIDDMMGYRFSSLFSTLEDNRFTVNKAFNMTSSDYFFILVPLEDYNAIYGETIVLEDDEALLFSNTTDYGKSDLALGDKTFRIVKELDTFADIEKKKIPMSKDYILIVNDPVALYASLLPGEDSEISYVTMFDTGSTEENGLSETDYLSFEYDLANAVERNISDAYLESRLLSRDGFYTLYGGMFFIGLFLGTLFLMATVMIIYYKQISEGYDDKARFEIMQKVGMSEQEIKRSIRTQIVMVFFLPLVFAIVHIGFAFEVIIKLLAVFNFVNVSLFFLCTVGIILAFAIIYFIVYFITARAYLRIVK